MSLPSKSSTRTTRPTGSYSLFCTAPLGLVTLTHLPTRLSDPLGQPFGWVSAAEGFVLLSAFIRWALLPKMKAGSWPIHSNRYLAKWLVSQIQESSLAVLHGIYATIYSAAWYRLLGAKVGKETELSTALGVVPDMLTLGDECFIADAVMLGDEHIDGGWMTVQPTVVSRRSTCLKTA